MFTKLMERVDRALDLFERSVAAQEEIADQMDGVSERLDLIILSFDGGSFYDMVSSKLDPISVNLEHLKQEFKQAFFYRPRRDSNYTSSVLGDLLVELRPRSVKPGQPGITPTIGNHLARIAHSLKVATNSDQIDEAIQKNSQGLRALADRLGDPNANSQRRR